MDDEESVVVFFAATAAIGRVVWFRHGLAGGVAPAMRYHVPTSQEERPSMRLSSAKVSATLLILGGCGATNPVVTDTPAGADPTTRGHVCAELPPDVTTSAVSQGQPDARVKPFYRSQALQYQMNSLFMLCVAIRDGTIPLDAWLPEFHRIQDDTVALMRAEIEAQRRAISQ
jgi:hypothetical protein